MSGGWLYREWSGTSMGLTVLTTLSQMLVFWALFLGIGPHLIVWVEGSLGDPMGRWVFELPALPWVGWGLFAGASCLGVSCAVAMSVLGKGTPIPMACAPVLVVAGPYRFVRNPMAVAGISQGLAVGLVLGSWGVLVYALAGALLWHFAVRPSEEADLLRRFGEPYRDYRRATPLWVPACFGRRRAGD